MANAHLKRLLYPKGFAALERIPGLHKLMHHLLLVYAFTATTPT